MVADVSSGRTRLLTPGTYSVGGDEQWFPDTFSWSPDGRSIAFNLRPRLPRHHLLGNLALIDSQGGEPRLLLEHEGMQTFPRWSPDGKELAFISTDRCDWVTNYSALSRAERKSPR